MKDATFCPIFLGGCLSIVFLLPTLLGRYAIGLASWEVFQRRSGQSFPF